MENILFLNKKEAVKAEVQRISEHTIQMVGRRQEVWQLQNYGRRQILWQMYKQQQYQY